jgi:hypothetical protein
MPASLSPTLAFASFITHAQILMPTMHAEILRLKNVREYYSTQIRFRIILARGSLISLWRGTAEFTLFFGVQTQGMAATLTLQGATSHAELSLQVPALR